MSKLHPELHESEMTAPFRGGKPKRFPILNATGRARSVPWNALEPHRTQAMRNHGQTLEQLAERGGLDCAEMLAIIMDQDFDIFFGPKEPRP